MKKILIAFLLINGFLLIFTGGVKAQQEKLLLAVTYYQTPQQKALLFDNSTQVWEYFEDEEISQPVFLSLISESQRKLLVEHGLRPQIIEEQPDLSRYVLLSPHHPQQPVNQQELDKLGEVTKLSPYHYLLRLDEGSQLPSTGKIAGLVQIPLPQQYVKPDILVASPSSVPPTVVPSALKKAGQPLISPLLLTFAGVYLLGVLIGIFILWRKKKMTRASLIITLVMASLVLSLALLFLRKFSGANNQPQGSGADLEIGPGQVF